MFLELLLMHLCFIDSAVIDSITVTKIIQKNNNDKYFHHFYMLKKYVTTHHELQRINYV